MSDQMKENATVNASVTASERVKDFDFPLAPGQILVTGIGMYTKDGKTSYILHGIQCFEDFQKDAGSYGFASVNEFTNKVDLSHLNVGDVILPQYGKGFQGRAVLIDCMKVGHISGKISLV